MFRSATRQESGVISPRPLPPASSLTEKETTVSVVYRRRHRSPANTSDRIDHRPKKIKRVKVVPQQRCLWRAIRCRLVFPLLIKCDRNQHFLLITLFRLEMMK
ncbi:hypothetical protein [Nostoc sp.]|uniref:hypothetical protein n=1 Tax=Nostoc sp. TaxID=1180 RepID=UPI002FF0B3E3